MAMDKELLFKARLPEADVEVPGVGTVRVRGLSRAEVMVMRKATDTENLDGPRALVIERKMLAAGMVDPELTEADAGRWQAASAAGEIEPVTRKIQELSGLAEGSAKEAVKEFEASPDAEFRVLPGAEAGHDGGGAASPDEQ